MLNNKSLIALICSFLVLLTACSKSTNEPAFADTEYVLKVMYYDEQQFFREYGELLYAKFPNIEIEVASTQSLYVGDQGQTVDYTKLFNEFVEREQPDVMMLNAEQYKTFAEEGRLLDLEPLIASDNYNIETFLPSVVSELRNQAGGRIHGLSPQFYSDALYYNIGLFDEYGIEHPTDSMTWEEVLQLAQRFPTDGSEEDRIYGFSGNEYMQYSQLLQNLISTEGISYVDTATKQMTIDTDDWKRIFNTVIQAYRSGTIMEPADPTAMMNMNSSYEDFLLRNKFVAGKSAMAMDGPYLFDQLRQVKDLLKDREAVNFALVTSPVDPKNREVGGRMQLNSIFAINPNSEQVDAAWEVVKYINSEDMARIKSKSTTTLLTRSEYLSERDGINIESFGKIKPQPVDVYEGYEDLPTTFFMTFDTLLNEQLKAAIFDNKSVEDVIETLQREGQKALMSADSETTPQDNTIE